MLTSDKDMTQNQRTPLPNQSAEAALRRVLKDAPQDLWLDTIRRTKGRMHDRLIHWMICQTQCDFAIAVHAFYKADPAHHLDLPRPLPAKPGPSDIFAQLLVNWDMGYYRTHNLAVEARDVETRQLVRINQKVMARPRGSLPFRIPARFLDPQGGQRMRLSADQSPDNARHLWPLYAALDLAVPDTAPGVSRKVANALRMMPGFGTLSRTG